MMDLYMDQNLIINECVYGSMLILFNSNSIQLNITYYFIFVLFVLLCNGTFKFFMQSKWTYIPSYYSTWNFLLKIKIYSK